MMPQPSPDPAQRINQLKGHIECLNNATAQLDCDTWDEFPENRDDRFLSLQEWKAELRDELYQVYIANHAYSSIEVPYNPHLVLQPSK